MAFASSMMAVVCDAIAITPFYMGSHFHIVFKNLAPTWLLLEEMCLKLANRLESYWKGWRWINPQKMSPHGSHLLRTPTYRPARHG